MAKRLDYISWDDYFMKIALLSAQRSKDPSCQVGCCIIDNNNVICGIGYNGMPSGISDNLVPWGKDSENELDNKYPYVCHAEMNAILNSNIRSLTNCSIYTTHSPCRECVKLIIQSGIDTIYFLTYKKDLASERMIKLKNIKFIQLILD